MLLLLWVRSPGQSSGLSTCSYGLHRRCSSSSPSAGGDYRSCLLVSTCKNSLLYSWAVRNNSADWVPAGLCLAARVSTFNKQCLQHCSTLSGPFTALAVVRLSACARIGLTAGFDARLIHFAVLNKGLAISGPCHRSGLLIIDLLHSVRSSSKQLLTWHSVGGVRHPFQAVCVLFALLCHARCVPVSLPSSSA